MQQSLPTQVTRDEKTSQKEENVKEQVHHNEVSDNCNSNWNRSNQAKSHEYRLQRFHRAMKMDENINVFENNTL